MQGPYYAPPPVQPPAPPQQQRPGWSQSGWLWIVLICSGLFVLFMAILAASLDTLPRPREEATKAEAPVIEQSEPEQAAEYVPSNPLAPDPSRGVAAHPKSPEVMWDIGPKPERSRDGTIPQADAWLRANLVRYDVLGTTNPIPLPGGWLQRVKVRADNAFGVPRLAVFWFYVKHGQLVDVGQSGA